MEDISKQQDIFFDSWQRLDAQYTEFARKNGLSYTGLIVLCYIYMQKAGSCTQKYLCDKTLLPKQTVNSVIATFAKKGLVTLSESRGDRRNKEISLTEEGIKLCGRTIALLDGAEKSTALRMGRDWETLVVSLDKYASIFRQMMSTLG